MKLSIFSLTTFTFIFLVFNTCFGQISEELEKKQGFREIKILNDINTVKTSYVNKGVDASRYMYAGDSKFLFEQSIDEIHIETDGKNLIRKIRIFMSPLENDIFFSFAKRLKAEFGTSCYVYSKQNSADGTMVWKTNFLYLDFIFSSISWNKMSVTINIGLQKDLPPDIRKIMFEKQDDGF